MFCESPQVKQMLNAIYEKQSELVSKIVETHPEIVWQILPRSGTAIHWASYHGNVDAINILLDTGVYIDLRDNRGWTPLHEAASQGQWNAVELLLNKGADVNAIAEYELKTPLFLSASRWTDGRHQVVDLLLNRGAVLDVHSALLLKRYDTVREILTREPQALCYAIDCSRVLQSAVLIWSLASGDGNKELEMIHFLLKHECQHQFYPPTEALHDAASHDNTELIQLLLDHKADPLAYLYHGPNDYDSVLTTALEEGSPDVQRLIAAAVRERLKVAYPLDQVE